MLSHLLATMQQLLYGDHDSRLRSKVLRVVERRKKWFVLYAHPFCFRRQASDKLVYYAGHDINIYFLRNFLRCVLRVYIRAGWHAYVH